MLLQETLDWSRPTRRCGAGRSAEGTGSAQVGNQGAAEPDRKCLYARDSPPGSKRSGTASVFGRERSLWALLLRFLAPLAL